MADKAIKVLVVDDSQTVRKSAEIYLKKHQYQVMTAEDGFDALGKVVDFRPDLIVMDIMMPRLDGYQTCAIIRRNAEFRGTPIVMLSGKDGVFDRARGRLVGASDYITKPFEEQALIQSVQTFTS
jgi:twitching motility two-component system response regulator PilG